MNMMIRGLAVVASFFFLNICNAQEVLKGWHLLDKEKDGYQGISVQKAYEFLKGKKAEPIIVAVLDSGIDTAHEDLKPILWKNPKEIPGNGIDDDGNGYIDDVHGWNFLGNKNGENVVKASSEMARIYHAYKDKFQDKVEVSSLNQDEKRKYEMWKRAAKEIEVSPEEEMQVAFLDMAVNSMRKYDNVLKEDMKKEDYTIEELENYVPTSSTPRQAKQAMLSYLKLLGMEGSSKVSTIFTELGEYIDDRKTAFAAKDNPPADLRKDVIGDNYSDINDKFYGNNNVMGTFPVHGTHVSGIIGALRNGTGADGVTDNVRIMMLRTVPNGDEYDKDIALAIRYAVDNGAKIINMSFGKGYSPEKHWVDEAVKYAESKNVLLVHAAGNDGHDLETNHTYPSPYYAETKTKAPNYITVGASSDPKVDGEMIAGFSNYGKNRVDVFAPGVKIYSTLPGGKEYGFNKGTSMAAPVVAGIAALIWSHFPHLTAAQVKESIIKTSWKCDTTLVKKPESKNKVLISELCANGIVNAYEAVVYASNLKAVNTIKKQKKESLPASSFELNKVN